ncbi:hypothetical protein [Dyadobacter fermentans]|uniref:Lipocalin-like domain-containing protein n=1 Tax=Dyadobacter fermentans (strain ATCC 700827 / DSM 18053 / CIP 107007 / KCTC 52180 / NS114) TaxID=471854 RepID=C6W0I7_DYAFD|nr:hypothetical protein [Dyadobacter fermentans]ACT93593.1 hypothetical protein Dfer_2375 [Dyadobacter fermentans DSM 18053]
MKKLIFCCLVVLMGACKDDKKDPEPEADYAPSFVGVYETITVEGGVTSRYKWDITTETKNQLNIKYTKNTEITISGTKVTLNQEYPLVAVKTTAQDNFEINEKVNVTQSTGEALNVRVSGIGSRIVNTNGIPQINITLKSSEASTSLPDEEIYLEFKKK